MAKRQKKQKVAAQWKVLHDIHINELEKTLEHFTGLGWGVVSIIGPLGAIAVVLHRRLVL